MPFYRLIYLFLFVIFFTSSAFAEDEVSAVALDSSSLDDNVMAVYSEACEKIKSDETKSSVRMRATDKASFNAVSKLSELSDLQTELGRHNFNVLVYNIVDNYVEDLAARTTKQDAENICVEVTGYVRKESLATAVSEIRQANTASETISDVSLRTEDLVEVQEQNSSESTSETSTDLVSTPTAQNLLPENVAIDENKPSPVKESISKKLLYVAPVEFYNNTTSESHTKNIRDLFANHSDFYITDKEDLADYVIKTKVLRAKVDPINSNTNRLQMVLAMGVKIKDSGNTSVEHQNRFILFSSDDDEQKVAGDLMLKLFKKASEPILNKIENDIQKNSGETSLITPSK